jgi:ketosteroid isomerase-like protein
MTVEEAVELMEKLADALKRRDKEAWMACVDPEFEGHSFLVSSEGGAPFRGMEGASDWFDNLMGVYESIETTLEQTMVVGDIALQLLTMEYVGKGSGIALAPLVAWTCRIRNGRYVYAHSHFSVAEAFSEVARHLASSPEA